MPADRPCGPEGPECEWKVRPPAPDKLARTLAAFHNGVGGSVWVGIEDDGRIVGVEDSARARRRIAAAADLCEPRPRVQVDELEWEGLRLLEVKVGPGAPLCVVETTDGRRVYVRDGSSSRPATPAQIKRMESGRASKVQLDDRSQRLLTALAKRGKLRRPELAKVMRAGERTCRRTLVPLIDGGLVHEGPDGFLSLTPRGHRRVRA